LKSSLSNKNLSIISLICIPLAFAGLPLYVHLPKFYNEALGLNLAFIGVSLLVLRIFDAVIDPIIGYYSDKLQRFRVNIINISIIIFSFGFWLLFANNFIAGEAQIKTNFILSLIIIYTSFSFLNVNYYALTSGFATSENQQSKISAFREGFILIGVLLASALPQPLINNYGMVQAFKIFTYVFIFFVVCALLFSIKILKKLNAQNQISTSNNLQEISFKSLFSDSKINWCLAIFILNTLPVAITSNIFLYYTDYVLNAASHSGYLLGLYFLVAVIFIPLWLKLSQKFGKKSILQTTMLVQIIAFIWTYFLQSGDINQFYIICALSGIALGGNLFLMPAIFADNLSNQAHLMASGFGVWNFINKFALALAAGVLLPVLSIYIIDGKVVNGGVSLIKFLYAVAPCVLMLVAFITLKISPLDKK
jgi:GPH family glycoside/pentoside/hexuronide:cation symporter